MNAHRLLAIACVAVLALVAVGSPASAQAPSVESAAALAAKASPELVGSLSKEIGGTPEQAAGAAGALFGLAKTRLKADEFAQVSNAVPGMPSLLKAAPATGSKSATSAIAQVTGSAGGLATAATAFTKLGLKPELVAKAVPALVSFVTKSGGTNVGNLLAGVLK
jgi:hypothetical protein